MDRKPGHEGWPPTAQARPDTDLLHAGQIGPRPASRLAYHTWRERRLADGFAAAPPRTAPQDTAIAQALGLGRPTLSESESKELLAAWGVASAREHRANSAEAAVAAAEQLGFPVALKVDSPDILHKTEAGVVRLNLA